MKYRFEKKPFVTIYETQKYQGSHQTQMNCGHVVCSHISKNDQ